MDIRQIQTGTEEYTQTLFLRDEVLRKPLGLNILDDNLKEEKTQNHFVLYFNGQIASCLIVQYINENEAKIRQVCTMPVYHGWGFGSALMLHAEDFIKQSGRNKILIHARETVVNFYENRDYKKVGERFVEVDLPHFKMEKYLTK